jgi:hypothetical protein
MQRGQPQRRQHARLNEEVDRATHVVHHGVVVEVIVDLRGRTEDLAGNLRIRNDMRVGNGEIQTERNRMEQNEATPGGGRGGRNTSERVLDGKGRGGGVESAVGERHPPNPGLGGATAAHHPRPMPPPTPQKGAPGPCCSAVRTKIVWG